MPYRTLLVHLDDTPRCGTRVALAARLAMRQQSHLIGLAPTGWIEESNQPGGALGAVQQAQRTMQALQMRARGVAERFEAQVHQSGLPSFEARVHEADPLASMVLHARNSDLAVVSQSDGAAADFPQQLLMMSGRPVLIVPRHGECADAGQQVLVAWNHSRESARALSDALPLLAQAQRVELVFLDQAGSDAAVPEQQMALSCEWLQRHGVPAVSRRILTQQEAGKALLGEARQMGADLLVMGAWGHSRLREFMLGGATRSMFAHMDLPVLMSH